MRTPRPFLLALGLAAAAGFLAFGAKLALVRDYGSDVPYFDAWDAIGRDVLIPAASGDLHAANFFRAQNEHRIVLSRLISYGLIEANGQWDPLLEMTAGAALHAAFCGALILFARRFASGLRLAAVALVTVSLFVLPFDWENTLQGLQSQHYLLLWTAFGAFLLCLRSAPLSGAWWWGFAVAVLGLGSMSSGFLAAAVVLLFTAVRCACERRVRAADLGAAALLAALCVAGVLCVGAAPGNDAFRAQSPWAWLVGAATALSWPAIAWPIAFAVLQLPVGLLALRSLRERRLSPDASVLLALALWLCLQIGAIAYARHGSGMVRSPRYMDLYALGAYVNAVALALRLRPPARSRAAAALTAVWAACFLCGLWSLQRDAHAIYLNPYPAQKASERRFVRSFLATGDPAVITSAPRGELPYPDAPGLVQLLSAPPIRGVLPLGIRPALPLAPGAGSYGFEEAGPADLAGGPPGPAWIARKGPARFVSEPIPPGLLPFLQLSVLAGPGVDAAVLRLEAADGAQSSASSSLAGGRWVAQDLAVPSNSTLRLVVDLPPGDHAFAFSTPVELGYLSWLNRWLLRRSGVLAESAALLFAAALLAILAGEPRPLEGVPKRGS